MQRYRYSFVFLPRSRHAAREDEEPRKQRIFNFFSLHKEISHDLRNTADLASLDLILVDFHRRLRFSGKDVSWRTVREQSHILMNDYCLVH